MGYPSSVALPRQDDLRLTQRLKDTLELIDVGVLDRTIVGDGDRVSSTLVVAEGSRRPWRSRRGCRQWVMERRGGRVVAVPWSIIGIGRNRVLILLGYSHGGRAR